MSEEIVDRLKAEGQLIRNTGTNSIRAVRIQLDRFEDIFETISENISAQTQMMASMIDVSMDQLKMNQETAEREEARRQREGLAEDQTPAAPPDTKNGDKDSGGKSRGLFDFLKGGIDLSKLLLGGAAAISGGIFAYNFLKGFIDEKTGGGFTRFEEGLIDTVQNINFESIKNSFNEIVAELREAVESIRGMAANLENISKTIEEAKRATEEFLENWKLQLGLAVGGAIATGLAWRYLLGPRDYSRGAIGKAIGMQPRQPAAPRASTPPAAPRALTPPATPRATPTPPAQPAAPRPPAAPQPPAQPRAAPTGGGRGTFLNDPAARAQLRADLANSRAGSRAGVRMNSAGRLVDSSGKYLSDADALSMMERTLDPKYSRVFSKIVSLAKIAGIVGFAVAAYQIYAILMDDEGYPTDEAKMEAMAPILGGLFGGLGGAALGAAIGSIPPASGWGTLIGALAGGILGTFAGNKLGYWIAKWAFGKEPSSSDHQDISGLPVRPRPNGGHDRRNWDKKYGSTHNHDGTPKNPIQRPANPVSPSDVMPLSGAGQYPTYGLGGSPTAMERIRSLAASRGSVAGGMSKIPFSSSQGLNSERISTAQNGSTNMSVMVNNSPNITPVVYNVQGGPNVTSTNVFGSGGSRSGTFGLSNAIN